MPVKVGKVGMDGSDPTILYNFTNTRPEFITIDIDASQLYWSTSNEAKVMWSCDPLCAALGNPLKFG